MRRNFRSHPILRSYTTATEDYALFVRHLSFVDLTTNNTDGCGARAAERLRINRRLREMQFMAFQALYGVYNVNIQ